MSSVIDRFKEYPPILQWTLVGSVILFVVVMWYQFVWGTAKAWDARAAEYQMAIERSERMISNVSEKTEVAILSLGHVEPLTVKSAGSKNLSAEIERILSQHEVKDQEIKGKQSMKFGRTEMPLLVPSGLQGEKLKTEVGFKASQEEAYRVIAALEQSPHIATVASVQMMKRTALTERDEIVQVRATVEAWVLAPARGAGSAGRTVNP